MTKRAQEQVFVVGLGGGTASGKTTLARALTQALGDQALLITHDRYYHSVADPSAFNYDIPPAFETALLVKNLQDLRAGRTAELPDYDYRTHSRLSEPERVQPHPVVLVEGILVLHDPALRALMDLTVFVHVDADVRLARRLQRDVVERGRDVAGVLKQYLRDVRPGHVDFVEPSRQHAQLTVDGTEPVEALVAQVLAAMAG